MDDLVWFTNGQKISYMFDDCCSFVGHSIKIEVACFIKYIEIQ